MAEQTHLIGARTKTWHLLGLRQKSASFPWAEGWEGKGRWDVFWSQGQGARYTWTKTAFFESFDLPEFNGINFVNGNRFGAFQIAVERRRIVSADGGSCQACLAPTSVRSSSTVDLPKAEVLLSTLYVSPKYVLVQFLHGIGRVALHLTFISK